MCTKCGQINKTKFALRGEGIVVHLGNWLKVDIVRESLEILSMD